MTYIVDFFIGLASGVCGNVISTYVMRYFDNKKKAQK